MGNEITVKVKGKLSDLKSMLEEKEYKVKEHAILDDVYMIPSDLELQKLGTREIISKSILIRKVEDFSHNETRRDIVNKIKKFNEKGEIIEQKAVIVKIKDCNEAIEFFKSIGYKKLVNIIEEYHIYSNNDISIITKDVKNGDDLVEVEVEEDNPKCDSIEKIKDYLIKEKFPLDLSDLFIKKVEVEVDKVLNRRKDENESDYLR